MDYPTAQQQCLALREAAKASPVMQVRYDLLARSREWERAAKDLADVLGIDWETGAVLEDAEHIAATVELAGTIGPGCLVFYGDSFRPAVRTMATGGQFSVHVEDEYDPRGKYLNRIGPTSPVVIKDQQL